MASSKPVSGSTPAAKAPTKPSKTSGAVSSAPPAKNTSGAASAPAEAGDYDALVKQLDGLNGKTDAASVTQRSALAKQMADVLAARRKTDRFQCHVSVSVEGPSGSGTGTLTNIGSGGGYLKTSMALEKFTEVKLTVRLAGRLAAGLVFPSQVRWVKGKDGAGVAFHDLGDAEAAAVKKVLAELVKDQPPLPRT